MKRFIVTYGDANDDICTVWVMAENILDAEYRVRKEYWDCKNIVEITME